MSSCSGNCSTCGSDCADRKAESLLAKANPHSSVKKVIAVVSGKGGVGKSTVTSSLAVAMARKGNRVGVLDADITGPSAPKAFGVSECQGATEDGLYPALSRGGIQVMSINLLLDDPSAPVVWRGPVIAGAVKQFWTDVIWEDVDYMFVVPPFPMGRAGVRCCPPSVPSCIIIITHFKSTPARTFSDSFSCPTWFLHSLYGRLAQFNGCVSGKLATPCMVRR